jgi:hypothetical protein
MPITSGGPVINIDLTARADELIAEFNKTNKALDQLKAKTKSQGDALREQSKDVKSATMSWTDFRSMYQTVLDVVRVGQAVWQATGQKFIDYSEQVKNMSRDIGASAEEASRLIQVADDVRLSYDSMTVAMKMAQKDGIEMSVEGLAKLSDEYLKLQPGVERTQFLLDKFGKSGMEMGKMMEQGGDSIRKMSSAIDDGLVLTDEAIASAEEYKQSVDALSDAWDALTITMGKEVAPAVTEIVKFMTVGAKAMTGFGEAIKDAANGGQAFNEWAADVVNSVYGTTDAIDNLEKGERDLVVSTEDAATGLSAEEQALKDMEAAAKAAAEKLEAISEANKAMLGTVEEFGGLIKNHAEEMAAAWAQVDEAVASGNVEAINEARAAVGQLAADYVQATNEIVYSMITAKLSVDGLTDAEFNAALQAGKSLGIFDDAAIAAAQAANEQANAYVEAAAQTEQAAQTATDATAETADAAEGVTTAVEGTAAATDGVTSAIQTNTGAQDALTASVTVSTTAIQNERLAVDNVALSIQIAIGKQDALTNSIWRSVAAARQLAVSSTGGTSAPWRDSGGPGVAGQPYMIGTGAQPEMFVPATNGTFVPNAGKGNHSVTVNISNPTGQSSENSIRRELKKLSYVGVLN